MNWDAAAAVGELIGAAAVVASLVFVGMQLRSNTRALRLSFTNDSVGRFRDSLMRLAENAETAAIVLRGAAQEAGLEGLDRYRFQLLIQAYMHEYSTLYMNYRSGAIDQQTFESLDSQMRNFCNAPGLRGYWAQSGGNFPAAFRDYMDTRVLGLAEPGWRMAGAPVPGNDAADGDA